MHLLAATVSIVALLATLGWIGYLLSYHHKMEQQIKQTDLLFDQIRKQILELEKK